MLNEEQRLKYIMGQGGSCPKCGNEDLEGGPVDIDGDIAFQRVHCLNAECDYVWIDTYCLCDIQTRDDEEPDLATARELRTALDNLLSVFDSMAVQGDDGFEQEPAVIEARATLSKGFGQPEQGREPLLEAAERIMVNARDIGECFIDRDDERYDPDNPEQMYPDWAALESAIEREKTNPSSE
jgi:hypothetical protein